MDSSTMFENRIADAWRDFELLDAGGGLKLERWGDVIMSRPDPQAIWEPLQPALWQRADASYARSTSGGGAWHYSRTIPVKWSVSYRDLRFCVEPMGFKHTGLFPEQAANWDWMRALIEKRRTRGEAVHVLNLFGYTGGATVACAAAGAAVCHVDAAKGMVQRASENVALSGLQDREVRYLVDDAFKFVAREIRRGHRYDAVIMDPPSYGRGPGGEVWKLEDQLFSFVRDAMQLLSARPLFFLLNSYTTGFSPAVTANILRMTAPAPAQDACRIVCGDLLLPVTAGAGVYLPCGSYAALEGKA